VDDFWTDGEEDFKKLNLETVEHEELERKVGLCNVKVVPSTFDKTKKGQVKSCEPRRNEV